ncbi:MAG: HNH endonuclease [Clostridia bacterium]|nr:HNH endonuclease [Clostridia bacterium]
MTEQDNIEIFKENHPSIESYWRSIILYGRNVASYKFSLGQSILSLLPTNQSSFSLEELAVPFSNNICEHIKESPKQCTSPSSSFLTACKNYNEGLISHQDLIDKTVAVGFDYVLDAFHVVNNANIPVKFFVKDFHSLNKKIILTDEAYKLIETPFSNNFNNEVNARWRLVETAWDLGVSPNLLNVGYDSDTESFYMNKDFARKDVTSARDALNGYQKGKCFYCYDNLNLDSSALFCDVDHFFPYTLQPLIPDINLNGVWNLVLACPDCNRGIDGKFARVPSIKYLKRLHKRNEYLISSHHPLRETLMNQTGRTLDERIKFLNKIDQIAINYLVHRWEVEPRGEEHF